MTAPHRGFQVSMPTARGRCSARAACIHSLTAVLATLCVAGAPPSDQASAGRPADDEVILVAIDPLIDAGDDIEFLALRAEAAGTGRLVLADGAVVGGRVLCEGLDIPPGATIFLDGDTEIIAMGDSVLDVTFVPLVRASLDEDDSEPVADASLEELDEVMAAFAGQPPSGPMQPSCAPITSATGKRGKRPPKVSITFAGNWTFNGLNAGQCAGPLPIQAPIPLVQAVVGARSAKAIGGAGGPGLNVTIRGVGNSTLTISGSLCNGQGANGADAVALAADGPPCECGGDAYAQGGRGGDAGTLTVTARHIVWDVLTASLTVQPGGAGGSATADAGDGGDCFVCGGDGGRGGHAAAIGGAPGKNGRIYVAASRTMNPAPQAVLGSAIFSIAPAPDGGDGVAGAGDGGDGGDCLDCAQDGGDGGKGGSAYARGAEGAPGMTLAASVGGSIKAYFGADGGWGGDADAGAGMGGGGGWGGDCLCSVPLQAGDGGRGGDGGSASARGGKGGNAKGGTPALALNQPIAGDGGSGTATCGDGGSGGAGGWCLFDNPEFCTPGAGGDAGAGGASFSLGGKGGTADAAALAGSNGAPLPGVTVACPDGLSGPDGDTNCPRDTEGDCCLPGSAPGCDDTQCALLVCAAQSYCCDLIWDGMCAEMAGMLCPACGGGGPSDCCVPHPGPGCNAESCMSIVCTINWFCCEVQWDSNCANIAQDVCEVCISS